MQFADVWAEADVTDHGMLDIRQRVEMTVSCRDADFIPKVPSAGEIVTLDGRDVQIMHNGVRVLARGYHGDWMASIIARLSGHHEPQEEAVFHQLLKVLPANPSMIELGSFWSYDSLWCLKEHPQAKVINVEPDPGNLAIGRHNAALNGFGDAIEFVNAFVGRISLPPRPFQTETSGLVDVPEVTVPELMERFGLHELDLLHCDAQGVETGVLLSCMDLMKTGRIRFCVISTHHHSISRDPLTHQRCLHLVRSSGGQILAEHDVHESFSGDGLIVAAFGGTGVDWAAPSLSYNRYSESLFRNPLFDYWDRIRTG